MGDSPSVGWASQLVELLLCASSVPPPCLAAAVPFGVKHVLQLALADVLTLAPMDIHGKILRMWSLCITCAHRVKFHFL